MCTSIMAGKIASEKGLLILARNEDFPHNNKNKYLTYRHYPEYYDPEQGNPVVEKGIWTLGNGLKVPKPEKSYSYSAIPDADGYEEANCSIGKRFYFEERGINEHNVAISATNSMQPNNSAIQADPLVTPGIEESIIATLILPQVQSAREAVECLGQYINQFGASEGNGILIGDPTQSWYLEIGSGHHWIAVRIPDDAYLAVANGMRIHSVDIDSREVMHSSGLYEFVVENKLLELPDRHQFNFAKAFGILGDKPIDENLLWYNEDRIWLIQNILTPSLNQKPRQYQYPLFLKPDRPISIKDVMTVMRATYKGTVLEWATPPATRPIGVDRTAESHIMTFNPKLPDSLKGMIWQAVGTPLGAPYMPLFNVMNVIPTGYKVGENEYNPLSAYWAFRGLYALAQVNDGEYLPEIKEMWQQQESRFINEYDFIVEMLIKMEKSDRCIATNFAKNYSCGIACQMVERADKKRNDILTQITKKGEPSESSVAAHESVVKM